MKENWKKFLTVVSLLSLSLVGLPLSNPSQVSAQEEVVVEFFSQKPEITPQLQALAESYSQQNEGITITITTVGSGEGSAALQAKFASGDEPAIMMLGGLPEVERYSETLLDVSELEVTDVVIDGMLDGGMINDVPLGVPMNIEGFGFMYNKAIFDQAGVNPEDVQSYSDFVSLVETLDSQKEELGIEAVFGFSGGENYIANQFSANFTSPEYNHSIIEAYEAQELNWEYGDQMQKYTDLINQYNVQPIITIDYSRSVEELFINDRVAMVHQGNWIIPTLNGIDPSFVQDKMGILPVFGENDETGRIVVGSPWYIGINSQLEEPVVEAAKGFVDWMFMSEEGQQAVVEELEFIPAQEGYDAEAMNDPVSQQIYQALLDGDTAAMTHKQYPDGWFQQVLYPEFQRYLDGQSTWDEFKETTSQAFADMRQ